MRTLSLVLALAAAAQAQVIDMVPEAKTMPAPDWVKPGVRLTWHLASASRAGETVTRSPFGRADAKDDKGNKYKIDGAGSAAGQGYTELYILAVEPKRVVFELRSYHLGGSKPSGPATLRGITGGTTSTPGSFAEYWIHPTALHNVLATPAAERSFLAGRIKHPFQGETRDAIQISLRGTQRHSVWIYDLNSGVLLQQNHEQVGAKGLRATGKDGTTYSGKRWSASGAVFREFTTLRLPWLEQPVPDWVRTTKVMEYEGGFKVTIAGSEGLAPTPAAQRFEPLEVGATWATFKQTVVTGPRAFLDRGGVLQGRRMAPSTSPAVSGSASPCGLWIPAPVLAKLMKGQAICSSEVTQFRAHVFYVGPDRGRDICVIRWENALQQLDWVYDRKSGALVRIWAYDRPLNTQRWFDLVATR